MQTAPVETGVDGAIELVEGPTDMILEGTVFESDGKMVVEFIQLRLSHPGPFKLVPRSYYYLFDVVRGKKEAYKLEVSGGTSSGSESYNPNKRAMVVFNFKVAP